MTMAHAIASSSAPVIYRCVRIATRGADPRSVPHQTAGKCFHLWSGGSVADARGREGEGERLATIPCGFGISPTDSEGLPEGEGSEGSGVDGG